MGRCRWLFFCMFADTTPPHGSTCTSKLPGVQPAHCAKLRATPDVAVLAARACLESAPVEQAEAAAAATVEAAAVVRGVDGLVGRHGVAAETGAGAADREAHQGLQLAGVEGDGTAVAAGVDLDLRVGAVPALGHRLSVAGAADRAAGLHTVLKSSAHRVVPSCVSCARNAPDG